MAVAALVLGILGIILPVIGFPLAIIALVLGIIHLGRAKRAEPPVARKGLAIAGVACGGVGLFLQCFILLGMILPAISMVREMARESQSANNMKQLVGAMIAWEQEHQGKGMPPSLEILVQDEHLSQRLLRSPSGADVPMPHYLYVRPTAEAAADQIVLVENPACRRNRKTLVCFGDSHTQAIKGDGKALWAQAQALAASPAAAADGVRPEAWTAGARPAAGATDF